VTTTRVDGSPTAEQSDDADVGSTSMPDGAPQHLGVVAFALIVGQAMLRLTTFLEGFFWVDDFVYVHRAEQGLGGAYLLQDYNGHLQPGQFLLVWVLQTLAPMNYGVVAVVMVAIQLATSLVVWLLIREFVGARVGALVPLVVYLFSPLTLPAFQWYAAALQAVPLQLAMASCLLFHRRHLRHGGRRDAIAAIAAFGFGLWFWEKALVILPVLLAVSVLWPSERGVLKDVRRQRTLWGAYLVIASCYVALYLSLTGAPVGGEQSSSVFAFFREIIVNSFAPSLFGGSYTGDQIDARLIGTEPTLLHASFVALLIALVAVTLWSDRRAWRAWALVVAYLGGSALLLAVGRGQNGAWFGRATRFIADASIPTTIAVAMALLPALGQRPGFIERGLSRVPVVAAVCAMYVASCLVTTVAVADRTAEVSTERYVRTVEMELERLGDVVVYDGPPPDRVLTPLVLQDHRVSRVVGSLPKPPRFNEPTDLLYEIDDDGRLVPTQLRSVTVDLTPDSACGWRSTPSSEGVVPLGGELMPWRWVIVVSTTSERDSPGTLSVGGMEYPVHISDGDDELWIVHDGPVGDIRLAVAGGAACVVRLRVGHIEQ
jgi:hypothetical protein